MTKRRFKRRAMAVAGVVAVSGAGLLATGTTPALAATTSTSYSCAGVQTPISLSVQDNATPGSTVQVIASTPLNTGALNLPGAVTTWSGSGTVVVAGDGSTTSLALSYTGATIPAGGSFPGFSVAEPLTMPASAGTVTLTMPATFTLSFTVSGLGSDTVTCTNSAPGSDTIHVSDAVPPASTATVTSISGETVTNAARDGATVNFTGGGYGIGDAVAVVLIPGGGGTAIPLTTVTATGGSFTGSATIPAALAAGGYSLTFEDPVTDNSNGIALTVLGTPSCSANPASGGAGTVTTVSCANFDPGASVILQGVTSAPAATTDGAVDATADALGNVSHSYTVNAPATVGIEAGETAPVGTIGTVAPFTFTAGTTGTTGGSSSDSQTVTATVSAGPLDLTEAGTEVTLSGITINGTPQTATGNLNAITVQDFRGSALGWTLNATATGFTGSDGGTIPAVALKVTPSCGPDAVALAASGQPAFPSTVTAGPAAALGSTATLCSAPSAALGSLTGGVFDVGGALSLTVPAFLPAGTYTDTITFSLG